MLVDRLIYSRDIVIATALSRSSVLIACRSLDSILFRRWIVEKIGGDRWINLDILSATVRGIS